RIKRIQRIRILGRHAPDPLTLLLFGPIVFSHLDEDSNKDSERKELATKRYRIHKMNFVIPFVSFVPLLWPIPVATAQPSPSAAGSPRPWTHHWLRRPS